MARLDVEVGIKNAGFKAGLDDMRSGVKRFQGDLRTMGASATGLDSMFARARAGLSSLASGFSSLKGGIAALGGAVVTGILVKLGKDTMEAAARIEDLSQRFGISTDAVQAWSHVLEDNGSSVEEYARSLGKLEVSKARALEGNEKLISSFGRLGVSLDDLRREDADSLLQKIGASSMEAAPMVDVLGESAINLRLALRQASREGLDTGNIIDKDVIARLAAADEKIEHLGRTFKLWIAEPLAAFANAMNYVVTGKFLPRSEPPEKFDSSDTEDAAGAAKREDRLQKIRDAEAEAARDRLSTEEKINALIEERDRLIQEYIKSDDEDKAIDSLEEAQSLQREIESEQKRYDEDRIRRRKEAAEKKAKEAEQDEDRMDRISRALEDEHAAREDDEISQLEGKDKIGAIERKRNRIEEEARSLEESDPEAAARKRIEVISLNAELRAERQALKTDDTDKIKEQEDKVKDAQGKVEDMKRAAASVPVDSLGAVGGGRGNFGSGDATLRAAEKQVSIQERILTQLQQITGNAMKKEADPWR